MVLSSYVPILKTKPSEMKALKELSPDLRSKVTPLIELTASRRSKLLPEGSVDKSVDLIYETMDKNDRFILDIASDEDLRNSELEEFYNPAKGYDKWCEFLEKIDMVAHVIPTVLLNLEGPHIEITRQAERLVNHFNEVLVRIPVSDVLARDVETVLALFRTIDLNKINLMLDAGFIGQNKVTTIRAEIERLLPPIKQAGFKKVRVASSSFPTAVTAANHGTEQYHHGTLNIDELNLHKALAAAEPTLQWLYSDYGTIHPVRYPTRGGAWVPRIDVPLENEIFWYRYRRDEGGYKKAAQLAFGNSKFDHKFTCWGNQQIVVAAQSKPPGMSPSLWIAVRVNIHLSRQVKRWN